MSLSNDLINTYYGHIAIARVLSTRVRTRVLTIRTQVHCVPGTVIVIMHVPGTSIHPLDPAFMLWLWLWLWLLALPLPLPLPLPLALALNPTNGTNKPLYSILHVFGWCLFCAVSCFLVFAFLLDLDNPFHSQREFKSFNLKLLLKRQTFKHTTKQPTKHVATEIHPRSQDDLRRQEGRHRKPRDPGPRHSHRPRHRSCCGALFDVCTRLQISVFESSSSRCPFQQPQASDDTAYHFQGQCQCPCHSQTPFISFIHSFIHSSVVRRFQSEPDDSHSTMTMPLSNAVRRFQGEPNG